MSMTRRDFLSSAAGAALCGSIRLEGGIVRSDLGARITLFLESDDDFSLIPYVQDRLVSMWDGIWNAGIGKTDDAQRMVDLCRNNGPMQVAAGSAVFGGMVAFDGELSFVCNDMSHANALVAEGIYDENATCMVSMFSDLSNVSDTAYREGITLLNSTDALTGYPCFRINAQVFRSLSLFRAEGWACAGSNVAQSNRRNVGDGVWQTTLLQKGMTYWTEMLDDFGVGYSPVITSSLSGRLPNEPGLVKRTITDAYVNRLTGVAGARFGRLLIYNRHLSTEEQQYNFSIDKERFGL